MCPVGHVAARSEDVAAAGAEAEAEAEAGAGAAAGSGDAAGAGAGAGVETGAAKLAAAESALIRCMQDAEAVFSQGYVSPSAMGSVGVASARREYFRVPQFAAFTALLRTVEHIESQREAARCVALLDARVVVAFNIAGYLDLGVVGLGGASGSGRVSSESSRETLQRALCWYWFPSQLELAYFRRAQRKRTAIATAWLPRIQDDVRADLDLYPSTGWPRREEAEQLALALTSFAHAHAADVRERVVEADAGDAENTQAQAEAEAEDVGGMPKNDSGTRRLDGVEFVPETDSVLEDGAVRRMLGERSVQWLIWINYEEYGAYYARAFWSAAHGAWCPRHGKQWFPGNELTADSHGEWWCLLRGQGKIGPREMLGH